MQFGLESLLFGRQVLPTIQPLARFTPPSDLRGNVFDYHVCFIRNGRFTSPRCSDKPALTEQPDLVFYLEPEDSFAPQEGDYYVDFRRLSVGGDVERLDLSASPFDVLLHPDYARFPTSGIEPLLNGQVVISSADPFVGDADTEAEYANVVFSYVPPDETPLPGGVYLTGSFNGWGVDLANELTWVSSQGSYEASLLIKQGEYEYRYTSPDPQIRRALHTRLPRLENLYTALVYYADASLNTDRLLAFGHASSR